MSDLNEGRTCAECLEKGRCLPTCLTRGGGSWTGTGETAEDGRTIITPCFMPDGSRGVRITTCASVGGQHVVIHNQFAARTGRTLAECMLSALETP